MGSDAGGDEAIFEVVVDGKTIIGKKKTKLLKVSTSSSSSSSRGGGDGRDGKGGGKSEGSVKGGGKGGGGEKKPPPDIAGGRTIFVSMEKLDQELSKARRRRRPNTSYQRKEDALRGVGAKMALVSGVDGVGNDESGSMPGMGEGNGSSLNRGGQNDGAKNYIGMTEAVMRLERLKAMSNRKRADAF